MKFVREPKKQSVDSILSWIVKYVVPSLEVLKKTGHWHEVIEAMDKANLSPEQGKLIMATTKNAITQASKQLNINFEKPTKKYNEDDEQGKGHDNV